MQNVCRCGSSQWRSHLETDSGAAGIAIGWTCPSPGTVCVAVRRASDGVIGQFLPTTGMA